MKNFIKGFLSGVAKTLRWLFDTKLIGPITSGDILQIAVFLWMVADISKGAVTYGPVIVGFIWYLNARFSDFIVAAYSGIIDSQHTILTAVASTLEEQKAAIDALQAENEALKAKSADPTKGAA